MFQFYLFLFIFFSDAKTFQGFSQLSQRTFTSNRIFSCERHTRCVLFLAALIIYAMGRLNYNKILTAPFCTTRFSSPLKVKHVEVCIIKTHHHSLKLTSEKSEFTTNVTYKDICIRFKNIFLSLFLDYASQISILLLYLLELSLYFLL